MSVDIPEAGPRWPDAVLDRRGEIPLTPDVGEVRTERLTVRPYRRTDADELFAISDGRAVDRMGRSVGPYDPERLVWRFMPAGPFADPHGLHQLHAALLERPDAQPYTGGPHGHRRAGRLGVAAGQRAARPAGRDRQRLVHARRPGLGVNREVTLALAEVLFALGYQRYEWKCNALNLRSRHAAEAMASSTRAPSGPTWSCGAAAVTPPGTPCSPPTCDRIGHGVPAEDQAARPRPPRSGGDRLGPLPQWQADVVLADMSQRYRMRSVELASLRYEGVVTPRFKVLVHADDADAVRQELIEAELL
jgi:hypothetical protein